MAGYAPDREYQFVVHAELIQERLFPDFRNMYVSSPFSADWLVENPDRKQPDSALPLSATARILADRLGSDAETIGRMNRNELFSRGLVQGGEGYVISFLPVQEVTGGRGGYLVCYAKEPLVVSLKRSFLLELSAFVGLLTLAFWLLVRWRCSVAELAEQSAHQQYEEVLLTQQERVEHEERTRISRELHDGIGQALHAVTLRLKLLLGGLGQDRSDERRMIGELIRDVQVASAELRNLVVSLRPQPLSGMQIDEAIRWLCRDLEKDDGVSLLLQTAGDFSDVSDRCSLTLFRVCQEGMTNILKHADAKRVQVSLQRQGNTIALIISDDGVGDALAGKHGGSGLDIMRERAELAGGRLQIDSLPGQGTKIFLELPCR
jgi:signal transduction histidine kinase